MELIDKSAIVAEINRVLNSYDPNEITSGRYALIDLRDFLDTLEVKDPYEQCIQYSSIKDGIKAHAETYSFNIESELFNQLTKEQQKLWRKEIEQACISGGDAGVELARDIRYKENVEMREVDLGKAYDDFLESHRKTGYMLFEVAKHFFELGLKMKGK